MSTENSLISENRDRLLLDKSKLNESYSKQRLNSLSPNRFTRITIMNSAMKILNSCPNKSESAQFPRWSYNHKFLLKEMMQNEITLDSVKSNEALLSKKREYEKGINQSKNKIEELLAKCKVTKKESFRSLSLQKVKPNLRCNSIDWSRSLNIIAMCSANVVFSYNPITNHKSAFSVEQKTVEQIKFIDDYLVVILSNNIIKIYDFLKAQTLISLKYFKSGVSTIAAYNTQRNCLTIGSLDGGLMIFDIRMQKTIDCKNLNFRTKKIGEIFTLKWNYQDSLLIGGCKSKIVVWDKKYLASEIKIFQEPKSIVKAIDWSYVRRNQFYAGGLNSDKTLRVYDTYSLGLISEFSFKSGCYSIQCNPNQKLKLMDADLSTDYSQGSFLSCHGSINHEILSWNDNFEVNEAFGGHTSRIQSSTLSPCGKMLATASLDNTVRFWNVFN